jgi:preprotein translocase subunit SecA
MIAEGGRGGPKSAAELTALIDKRARDMYQLRELEYPVDTILLFTFGPDAHEVTDPYAAEHLRQWALEKFGTDLTLEHLRGIPVKKLRTELVELQEAWLEDGKIEEEVDRLMSAHSDPAELAKAANARFSSRITNHRTNLTAEELTPVAAPAGSQNGDAVIVKPKPRDILIQAGRLFLRNELTSLEQFVLISIFDQSWKDHLYAMDMLKAGIGLQAFAERDPRIAYKREGYRYFQEMMAGIRDKVTDLIFRARVQIGQSQARNAYQVTAATHETETAYGVAETVPTSEATAAAGQPQGEATKVKTIVRETPKVGRNDPCPCGSGKKYKKCHGANAA